MPQYDWLVLMAAGVLFILLGVGAIFWGRNEEKNYYNGIAHRYDVREYLEHSPIRFEPGALKIGGRIAIIVGIALLIWGSILKLLD